MWGRYTAISKEKFPVIPQDQTWPDEQLWQTIQYHSRSRAMSQKESTERYGSAQPPTQGAGRGLRCVRDLPAGLTQGRHPGDWLWYKRTVLLGIKRFGESLLNSCWLERIKRPYIYWPEELLKVSGRKITLKRIKKNVKKLMNGKHDVRKKHPQAPNAV